VVPDWTMDSPSFASVPDWSRGCIRGVQGVVIPETGFKNFSDGVRRVTHLQGKFFHRRAAEEEKIQRWSNACSRTTPCIVVNVNKVGEEMKEEEAEEEEYDEEEEAEQEEETEQEENVEKVEDSIRVPDSYIIERTANRICNLGRVLVFNDPPARDRRTTTGTW